jgi:lipopolysaccharide/colanic/teichoic acid biosynthesis glycosyltransferase
MASDSERAARQMHEFNELTIGARTTDGSSAERNGDAPSGLMPPDSADGDGRGLGRDRIGVCGAIATEGATPHVRNRYERFMKPAFDRVGAVVMLLLLTPLLAAIAVAIRITMGRGVIFKQKRIGKDERLFTVYKFRTMRPDRRCSVCPPMNGQERRRTHKSPYHPLVTPVGRVLRQLSLDELPQLWNVVRGDMSLVGPRPELPWIVDRYEAWQHRRHEVKPGLTGLWQVTTRGNGVMHDRTDVDLEYLDRISLRTDVWLMLRTIPVMVGRRGSF